MNGCSIPFDVNGLLASLLVGRLAENTEIKEKKCISALSVNDSSIPFDMKGLLASDISSLMVGTLAENTEIKEKNCISALNYCPIL